MVSPITAVMSADDEKTASAHAPLPPGYEEPEATGEKDPAVVTSEGDAKIDISSDGEVEITDIFKPLPPLEGVPPEANPLTARAVMVGLVLGSLVNASNVYLGEYSGLSAPGAVAWHRD